MLDEGFKTSCINCGRESHFFGWCWWGVALLLPLVLTSIGLFIYALVVNG